MERKKDPVVKKGVSFTTVNFKQIEDLSFEKFDGNFSKAVNGIVHDYFQYLSHRKETLAQMQRRQSVKTGYSKLTEF